ncbi:D-arabinono-1,4-lactone oxidase [Kitasatospora sp. NPDC004669]|uniref:D-arabinono-1,4-lactone oxidase n=1 Tax=Kitasatospora sp. NPDC004669 TaxID=3154555 RepID=UPI0033AC6E4D
MTSTLRESTAAWSNWARTVRCEPRYRIAPRSEEDIAAAVALSAERGLTVRAAGSGHSFNPLALTDGVMVDLSRYSGVESLDREGRTITVRAGTSLAEISAVLDRAGLALANIGTLAEQTVAGAISTGNHGTGLKHGTFADQVEALRLVTANGGVRELSRDGSAELLRCARTSMGTLGVISSVTLRCVPRFRLAATERTERLDTLLEGFEEWAGSAEHVSCSWSPWKDTVCSRLVNATEDAPTPGAGRRRYATTLSEVRCGLVGLVAGAAPAAVPRLDGFLSGRGSGPGAHVDVSHKVFTFPQPVKFVALEHALALGDVPEALRRLRGTLRRAGRYSPYSVLVRVGASDDAPLSPAYGRATGYVNLTVPRSVPFLELLRVVERELRDLGGRPHWGKAHTATEQVLAPLYPEWDVFQDVRADLDPQGLFTNDFTARVLGPVRPAGKVG